MFKANISYMILPDSKTEVIKALVQKRKTKKPPNPLPTNVGAVHNYQISLDISEMTMDLKLN